MEKVSLYKFTYVPLLKMMFNQNQKCDKQPKKKKKKTQESKRKKNYEQRTLKSKEEEEEEEEEEATSKRKKKKTMKKNNEQSHFLPSVFSPFLGEKLFGGSGEKTHGPYYLFSFLPTQPNKLQKSFPSHFLFKVFPPPYFTSKQTHP